MHYGDKGGAEWCQHYNQPIRDLKSQPVTPGEEVVVDVTDIHESGAGVGRTEDGFIVMVDGLLPEARAKVRVIRVHSNHATGEEVERLPLEEESDTEIDLEDEATNTDTDTDDAEADAEADSDGETEDEDTADENTDDRSRRRGRRERLGSRDNFWGN
jgi:predicted RNA-binding protein with TRAM domain